jgi:hypothetical protein
MALPGTFDGPAAVLRDALVVTVAGYSPSLIEYFCDDVMGVTPVMTWRSRDELMAQLHARNNVFSDVDIDYHPMQLADGRWLAEWQLSATQTGSLVIGNWTVPASSRRVTLRGAAIAAFLGSQIREFHQYWDALGLLRELGALSEPSFIPGG